MSLLDSCVSKLGEATGLLKFIPTQEDTEKYIQRLIEYKKDCDEKIALQKETKKKYPYSGRVPPVNVIRNVIRKDDGYLERKARLQEQNGCLHHLVIEWCNGPAGQTSFRIDDLLHLHFWAKGKLSDWFRLCWQKCIREMGFIVIQGRCAVAGDPFFPTNGAKKEIQNLVPPGVRINPMGCCLTMRVDVGSGQIRLDCLAHLEFYLQFTAKNEVAASKKKNGFQKKTSKRKSSRVKRQKLK